MVLREQLSGEAAPAPISSRFLFPHPPLLGGFSNDDGDGK